MRHGPAVVAVVTLLAGCGSEGSGSGDEQRTLVREVNAVLRGPAVDVRVPGAECVSLPRRTRAELRRSPQRIAVARERLRRLRVPASYERVRSELDEGLRLMARANALLLFWSERSGDPGSGECGQSTDNLRDSAHDEIQDAAKPHLQAFLDAHNPVAERLGETAWELGAAGLIPRSSATP